MPPAHKPGEPSSPDALFDAAEEALDAGAWEEALALADRLAALAPGEPDVARLKALALAQGGQLEEAERTLTAARRRWPEVLDLLYGHAELLVTGSEEDRPRVEAGLDLCARGVKLARKKGDVELLFELLLLEGIGHNQLGECARALQSLDAALELQPPSVEARLERALALFELCRFAEAERTLHGLLADAPGEAWVHHTLGLLAERQKDAKAARRHFKRAQELAPEDFPPPVQLSEEEFDRAVEAAIAQLPAHVREHLDNVTIAVEEVPSDEDLLSSEPPLSPAILGVFRGTPLTERSVVDAATHATVSIALYQRNLERFARSREELVEQIGITVMHEVGHLLGLDEEDLQERGLE
jgi:predicted Zn-dependent protease with MMP-like domain